MYSGAECGQIDGTWLPGTITGKGQFVSLNASLLTLNKQLKKTPKAKKGAVNKKIAALKKRILSQATTCQQLGTGIVAPRSSQSATAGATTIDWTFDLRNASASDFGSERSYFCPPNGQQAAIYGSDTYTADSAVCPAAVHAGVVTFGF